jgi:3-oxoacyl-[acyl-carrier protein] reductase
MLLKDKVAIVTGGAAGIGKSIVELFAQHGARVFVIDCNRAGVEGACADVKAAGGVARPFTGDVRRREDIAAVVDAAIAEYGRIDILVNNAGIYPRLPFLKMTEAEWDRIHDVNLKGVYYGARLVAPHMTSQRSGKIVNISSVTFFVGIANLTHYISSKGAVIGFTRALAREMGPFNVHVNCLTPGAVEVESEKAVATPEQVAATVALQSLERRIVPLDIARTCLFLCSELSDGLTGQTLNVDGGWIMH